MMRALLILVVACGDNLPVDDGFGQPCEAILDGRIFTLCETEAGLEGVCAVGVCRRWCEMPLSGCPAGQHAIPTIANRCWCEP